MPNFAAVPGISELKTLTQGGNSCIKVALLDGPIDLNRACFKGAYLTQVDPYWQPVAFSIAPSDIETYRAIENSLADDATKRQTLAAQIPNPKILAQLDHLYHATHVASNLFGQTHSPVSGIAPRCTGIGIPLEAPDAEADFLSPLNLARAFELALELGVNIIHCGVCLPTQTGMAQDILARAVQTCRERNILVIAPAGNDGGDCWCLPALLPGAIAVGAMKDNGQPFQFSNWGGNYQSQGILAPGENILGAQPGTDIPKRKQGTSCAAPIVTGVAALLMSWQQQQGKPIDAAAIRTALFNSSIPCNPQVIPEPERCLRGKLNVPGTVKWLSGGSFSDSSLSSSVIPRGIAPSNAQDGHIYTLGTLGYDFGSEARRDSFKQLMPAVDMDGLLVPANPYDTRQMVDYLEGNPSEGKSLIWTINQDLTPIYVIEPEGSFSADIYEMLLLLLAGQIESEDSDDFLERVSLPARRTTRTVELFSGQVVPVITVDNIRSMYGWKTNILVDAAVAAVTEETGETEGEHIRRSLTSFLNRVYYDLRNLGQTSRDRALNFAATNVFQAASTFAEAIADGRELENIEVLKSPFCRLNSDCWDVKLKFFDPENSYRARKVFRFTLDVSERVPVTLGEVKSWSIPVTDSNGFCGQSC